MTAVAARAFAETLFDFRPCRHDRIEVDHSA
jgi:hypothetical protein